MPFGVSEIVLDMAVTDIHDYGVLGAELVDGIIMVGLRELIPRSHNSRLEVECWKVMSPPDTARISMTSFGEQRRLFWKFTRSSTLKIFSSEKVFVRIDTFIVTTSPWSPSPTVYPWN